MSTRYTDALVLAINKLSELEGTFQLVDELSDLRKELTVPRENEIIVCEITKNWPEQSELMRTVGSQFEEVIRVNKLRGYDLNSWQYQTWMRTESGRDIGQQETIIAVFRRVG